MDNRKSKESEALIKDTIEQEIAVRSRRQYMSRGVLQIQDVDENFYDTVVHPFKELVEDNNVNTIQLVINSNGGLTTLAGQLCSWIRSSPKPVIAEIITAISAGFVIATQCHFRICYPASMMMHHEAWMSAYGNKDEISRMMPILESADDYVDKIVEERTKITKEIVNKHRGRDWWITPEEALRLGVVDTIFNDNYQIDPAEVVSAFTKRVPETIQPMIETPVQLPPTIKKGKKK